MEENAKNLLGIKDPDIKILKIGEESKDGVNFKIVEVKSNKKKYRCPSCDRFTCSIHDKLKPSRLKMLELNGHQYILVVNKRRFKCHECNIKFTEELNLSSRNCNVSNEVTIRIRQLLLKSGLTIKMIADICHVSDNEVRKQLKEAMKDYPEHIRLLPSVISFDEFKADTKRGKYALAINDILHKKTLEILPTRKKADLINYLMFVENRKDVKVVVCDMYEPYLLVVKAMFPKAIFVVDKFHYIRYIMDALDDVRIRLQKENGGKGKIYNLLKNKKNVSLLRKYSNDIKWFTYMKIRRNNKTVEILRYDMREQLLNISDDLKRGYQLKEEFLDIVNHVTYEESETALMAWIDLCNESDIKEFIEAAKTINNWLPYICNSFINKKYTNGFTEGRNNKIKVEKRIAYGYKNFEFFRLRLMYMFNGKLK